MKVLVNKPNHIHDDNGHALIYTTDAVPTYAWVDGTCRICYRIKELNEYVPTNLCIDVSR